ncbi:hypothetical protein NECID01_1919 [Nematocida sp. AWRm77]|nr:hypothetical protein NECID01_1919 [Nematocida sp. AWRm77]
MKGIRVDEAVEYAKNLSLHWEMPVFAAVAYVIWVVRTNKKIRERQKREEAAQKRRATARPSSRKAPLREPSPKKKSALTKLAIFLHNTGMSAFSMLVFAKTFPVVWTGFWTMKFSDFIEDANGALLNKISFWIWIFYISKYYEVVDTAILFVSGKESSFLQMYHHAGAIVACWLVSLSQSYCGWIWVVLNSFIHSLMYLYYGLTVYGIRPPFKRLITFMQIAQFFTGIIFGFFYITNPKSFSPDKTVMFYQYSAIFVNMVYVVILIGLFLKFERDTYRKKASIAKQTKQAKTGVSSRRAVSSVLSTPTSKSVLMSPA